MPDKDIEITYSVFLLLGALQYMEMTKDITDDFDAEKDTELSEQEYKDLIKEKKKELLLENRRSRLTTMTFHDWFSDTYKRPFKPSDKHIADAYHSGAADEIENNEYILEHAELKMQHYKTKTIALADKAQILSSLLETISRKSDLPENLKKLVRKALAENI